MALLVLQARMVSKAMSVNLVKQDLLECLEEQDKREIKAILDVTDQKVFQADQEAQVKIDP